MLDKLAERLDKICYDALPGETVQKTKTAILNYIGGSLPGADAPPAMAEMQFWMDLGAEGACPVLGHCETLNPLAAAATNAMMGQFFLQEDCHEESISHPGVIVIPTALAIGQARQVSGKEFISAVVCGYESQGKIGRGLIQPGFPRNGLRPASCVGPFGSVSTAAKLLGLNKNGIKDAITIAANSCSGVMECTIVGSDDMCIQNCNSVKNGIMAAYEAQRGLHGAHSILDGLFGLGHAFNNGLDCDWSILGSSDAFEIDDTFVKIYPGCGHVLPTAQAAVAIVREHKLNPDDIDHVVVGTRTAGKNFPGCDNTGPFEGYISAMMSHQFMVGAAICRGTVNIAAIKDYAAEDINAVAARVQVEIDPEVDANAKSGGRVTVYMRDGRVFSNLQEETLGQDYSGVRERLFINGKDYYSEDRIEQIIKHVEELEKLDDISELAKLLIPNRKD